MGIREYFRAVPAARPEEIREVIRTGKPGEYVLIDVRTPREYQAGHLPGAQLIPLNELPNRLSEIDRDLPAYVY
jgi:rhodanese-related sulfurtransferase